MANKRSWSELSTGQRTAVVLGGAVELALTTWAARDLASRPAERVRGPKAMWAAAMVVQPVGPIAYALYGRR